VGFYGASYFGQTQWAAASLRPPALKAMVPFITWSEPLDGTFGRGGALEFGTSASWTLQMALNVAMRKHAADRAAMAQAVRAIVDDYDRLAAETYWELPLRDFAPLKRAQAPNAINLNLDSLADPALADHLRVNHDQVEVPTLNAGGWYDIFLQGTIDNFNAMRRRGIPTKLLIGPWSHSGGTNPVGELNFGFGSQLVFIDLRMDFQGLQLRWFDHWLKGVDTGMLAEPPVKIFVMGLNRWRDEQEFPLARAVEEDIFLREGGRLDRGAPEGDERADEFDYDPASPVPTLGGATLLTPEFRSGPYDQRRIEERGDVLVYTGGEFARDVEVTGPVKVTLFACSTSPSTDFVARLCDVYPDGRSINLTDGIVRVRATPNEPAEHLIDLWATSNLFRAGHRLRLQVTSSSFPRWDRNLNTGEPPGTGSEPRVARQTILHDRAHPSRVTISVVPA
jgi:putative CocE/NonD family hydrolase